MSRLGGASGSMTTCLPRIRQPRLREGSVLRVPRDLIPTRIVKSNRGRDARMRPGDVREGGSGFMMIRSRYTSCSACNADPSDSSSNPVCVKSRVSTMVTSRISRASASDLKDLATALCVCCISLSISTA